MLDLPGHPVLDKTALIGRCARLPINVDIARLRAEFDRLPADVWGTTGGRVGVHRAADAVFLRGYAPADGNRPIDDRPTLAHLPYVRYLLEQALGGEPQRCLLARLPGGAAIAPHVDRGPYFSKTLRIHVPIATHDRAWMVCDGLSYVMQPGEAWGLNNGTLHAVWNAHATEPRTHLICDFLPAPGLLDLLARADRGLGRTVPEVDAHLASLPRPAAPGNG